MTRGRGGNERRRLSRAGFTLLELMISLTITAVIVLLISGALRLGFRAWEKGDRAVADQQRQRLIFDRIKRQLASVAFSASSTGKQTMIFRGSPQSLEFVSRMAIIPSGRPGNVGVKYIVGSDEDGNEQLMFYEDSLVNYMLAGAPPEWARDRFLTLIEGVRRIRFEYLNTLVPESPPFWQEAWDAEVGAGLPGAVRVRIDTGDPSELVTLVAPVVQGGSQDE